MVKEFSVVIMFHQILHIMCSRKFEPPFYRQPFPPLMAILFIYFLRIPRFRQDFSDNIAPMKYLNLCDKVSFSFLDD